MIIDANPQPGAGVLFQKGRRLSLSVTVLVLLFIFGAGALAAERSRDFTSLYQDFLEAYWHPSVTINRVETTVFDYAGMVEGAHRPGALFQRTLRALEAADLSMLTKQEAKAFWINAYNFGAMRLIVDHYPVDSIRSLKISGFRGNSLR